MPAYPPGVSAASMAFSNRSSTARRSASVSRSSATVAGGGVRPPGRGGRRLGRSRWRYGLRRCRPAGSRRWRAGGITAGSGGDPTGAGPKYLIQRFGQGRCVPDPDPALGAGFTHADQHPGKLRESRTARACRDPLGVERFHIEHAAVGDRQRQEVAVVNPV